MILTSSPVRCRFCGDPSAIATVKIEFARFLQAFTADVKLATSALKSARDEQPSLEGEFETFCRLRTLQQKQQSQQLGANRDMNLVALVEFNKRLTMALQAHEACIRAQINTYNVLERFVQHTSTTVTSRLDAPLDVYLENAKKGQRLYAWLLRTNPSAPQIAQSFAHFCKHVLHDNALAEQYDGAGNGAGSVFDGSRSDGGSSFHKSATTSMASSSTTLRTFVPLSNKAAARELQTKLRWGAFALALFALSILLFSHIVVAAASDAESLLQDAGIQRKLSVDA